MYRLLALLALAVCNVGCSACCGPGYDELWGYGSQGGCGDECGYGGECGCGCEAPCDCGNGCSGGCGNECGYGGECGCEPSCGCSSGQCGQDGCWQGGVCGEVFRDCPLCQGSCCLFRRYGCDGSCYDECGQCGNCSGPGGYPGHDYDFSACARAGGRCLCPYGNCCGCCETYSGCCAPCCQTQGPGCCASGDHQYNFAPGPPTGQVAYPYYTVRGPRDFLQANPAPIGPY
jgi:hypothetical protein